MKNRLLGLLCLSIAMFFTLPMQANAQSYPTKLVRIVVPYAAGGPSDVAARSLAKELGDRLGQQVIIDNKPGGGQIIGAQAVINSPADGHTLYFGSITSLVLNKLGYKSLPYDPVKDFAPISVVTKSPLFLLVTPDFPARNFQEFVVATKAKPGQFAYASIGTGTTYHVVMEVFKQQLGIDLLHVPYSKGGAAALVGILGNQVQTMMDMGGVSKPLVEDGKLRALAVSSSKRSPAMPNVPTLIESGMQDFDVSIWFGLLAPAGTPKPIVDRLSREVIAILKLPEFQAQAVKNGYEAVGSTPAEFANLITSDMARWAKYYKAANVEPQ